MGGVLFSLWEGSSLTCRTFQPGGLCQLCIQSCTQLTKDLRVKTSCNRFIINSCVLLKNLVSVCVNQLLPCLPLHPSPTEWRPIKVPRAGRRCLWRDPHSYCAHSVYVYTCVLWIHCFSFRECVHGKYCRMCTLMLVITNQPVYFKHCKISTATITGV